MYVPPHLLRGKLPATLLQTHRFFAAHAVDEDERSGIVVRDLTIRGYPHDDSKSKHVLLLTIQQDGTFAGKQAAVSTVRKRMLDGSAPDRLLLNLMTDSNDLRSLTLLLSRFDDLPYVLVWTQDRTTADGEAEYVVDSVELTRLQLNLRGMLGDGAALGEGRDVLLRNGQQLRVSGGSAMHLFTAQDLPLEGREALFSTGQEVVLRGSTVVHMGTGRHVQRTDALFRRGDQIRVVNRAVEHVRTGTIVPRLDDGEAADDEGVEITLSVLKPRDERIGALITLDEPVHVSFKNVVAVFVDARLDVADANASSSKPIFIKDVTATPNAEIAHVDASNPELSFTCRNEAYEQGAVTVTLHGLREEIGEEIDLSKQAHPPIKCSVRNVADREKWRLNLVEMPELYLYRPPGECP